MIELLSKGKLGNQKVIDLIRLISRMMDMWLILLIFELLYISTNSRMIALMGIAFCMTLNYLIILIPPAFYQKISRRKMILIFLTFRTLLILGLIWKTYYFISFPVLIVLGLLLSVVTALSNGMIIVYRHPVRDEERIYQISRRIIFLTVPLVAGFLTYRIATDHLTVYYILYTAFTLNGLLLPMIPFIRYNTIDTFEMGQLAFTIDGLMMCAVEYMFRVLVVIIIGFEVPIAVGVVMYVIIVSVIIMIAWYKNGLMKRMTPREK